MTKQSRRTPQSRNLFWSALGAILAIVSISGYVVAGLVGHGLHEPDALLSTPAAFTLLAIVIAMAAYLRQVAVSAEDKWDNILADRVPMYPSNSGDQEIKECTQAKVAALGETCNNMAAAAPLMILISIVVAARLLAETITRLDSNLQLTWRPRLVVTDVMVLESLVITLACLGILHRRARRRDRAIRQRALDLHARRSSNAAAEDALQN